MTAAEFQLVHAPFYDDRFKYSGWCPDCGLEQHNLVVNAVRLCDGCRGEFTFNFEQLKEVATNATI